MGDIRFQVNKDNIRALSPPELYSISNLDKLSLFSPDSLTMQDEMLLDKSAGKLHMQQLSPNPDQSSDNSEDYSLGSKTKSGDSSPLTVPDKIKINKAYPEIDHSVTSAVLHQHQQLTTTGLHHPHQPGVSLSQLHQQESANSVISSNTAAVSSVFNTPSLWSSANNSEETFFQNIPAMNGAMHQFQNFPLNSSPLFSPTLSPQAQLNMQQAAQRRSLPPQPSAPQQNLFPTSSQLQQAQLQAGNLLLANKHLSWNAGQPTSWNTAAQQTLQQQQSNPWGTVGSPSSAGTANPHRRSMPPLSTPSPSTHTQQSPSSLGLSPNKMKASSNPIISPPKFHRSTSLPGKSFSQPHLPSMGSQPTHLGPGQQSQRQGSYDFSRDMGGGDASHAHGHHHHTQNGTQNGTHGHHLSGNSTLFPFQVCHTLFPFVFIPLNSKIVVL